MSRSRTSAGCVLFRIRDSRIEVLLGHMGGPFWMRKDEGAWSIPKGEYDHEREDALEAALREFVEEMGVPAPAGPFLELGTVRQAGGKSVTAWAAEGDLDETRVVSNTFEIEWPKGSGKLRRFAEIDRACWFGLDQARRRIVQGQVPLLDRLQEKLVQERGGAWT
jgi:predicted NUDIX family NTP pyrophosphohydrolase